MRIRLPAALALALLAGGCGHDPIHLRVPTAEGVITGMGLPKRGFVTDALFPDGTDAATAPTVPTQSAPPPPILAACTDELCTKATPYCTARGYAPGTDGFTRCQISVREFLARR
jgi:hypothetical protein